ncbi:hypothetical protein DFJ73DRAFT_837808 [Zopfochytrium polystomum]|nr:hypothetical protein DFJ73DRAFT_837808 [Zopfochytrium polystomum]
MVLFSFVFFFLRFLRLRFPLPPVYIAAKHLCLPCSLFFPLFLLLCSFHLHLSLRPFFLQRCVCVCFPRQLAAFSSSSCSSSIRVRLFCFVAACLGLLAPEMAPEFIFFPPLFLLLRSARPAFQPIVLVVLASSWFFACVWGSAPPRHFFPHSPLSTRVERVCHFLFCFLFFSPPPLFTVESSKTFIILMSLSCQAALDPMCFLLLFSFSFFFTFPTF